MAQLWEMGLCTSGGPDSRDHSTAKPSRDIDDSIAHSSTHRTAHKSNPASGDPDLRNHSTAHPSGLSNPSDKTEGAFSKGHHPPRHTSDHPPLTPSKSEGKHSVLTPEQRKHIQTLVRSIKKRKTDTKPTKKSEPTTSESPSKHKSPIESKDLPPDTPFSSETRDNASPVPPPSEDIDSGPSSEHSEVTSLPPSPRSPASPDSTTPRSPSSDKTPSPNPTMGTVKELAEALIDKLKDIGRHPTIPLPQFRGKKGEDPNDHCMKVEDYFSIFKIEPDEDQKKRFLETLFEKARRWASTIDIDKLDGYNYENTYTKEQKKKSFKWQFLKRFA